MTFLQENFRKGLLRAIHQHGAYSVLYAGGAWEDWLHIRFGVLSSAELSIKELKHILDVFNHKREDTLSLKPDIAGRALVKQAPKSGGVTQKQLAAIFSMWEQKARDKSERALLHFIKRATGILYISIAHLKKDEATKVILALSKVR
jgi:hypothetical protein